MGFVMSPMASGLFWLSVMVVEGRLWLSSVDEHSHNWDRKVVLPASGEFCFASSPVVVMMVASPVLLFVGPTLCGVPS